MITVSDQGVGIPPEEQTRVFERFYRGAGNAQAEATLARVLGYTWPGPSSRPTGAVFGWRATPVKAPPSRFPAAPIESNLMGVKGICYAEPLVARVTVPSCQNQFEAPVEQVLDVSADPNAKVTGAQWYGQYDRLSQLSDAGDAQYPVLSTTIQTRNWRWSICRCRPARDHLERQQAIGRFTTAVMDSLPPEERRAYLLQPAGVPDARKTWRTEILEADGVTQEMIEEQRAKAELLQRMVEAPSEKRWRRWSRPTTRSSTATSCASWP